MKTSLKIALGSFLAAAAVIKAAPAFAEPVQSNVSVVRTADLDLSTDSGRHALDQRLVIAAREVCGEAADVDLAGQNLVRQCRQDVLTDARGKSERLAIREVGPILVAAKR